MSQKHKTDQKTAQKTEKKTERKTMQQYRAEYALEKINALGGKETRQKEEITQLLRKLPALIHGSGLGQTLAFLRAKQGNDGEKSHAHVYTILSDWLCQSNNKGCVFTGGNPNDALQAIAHGNMRQYMAAQNDS